MTAITAMTRMTPMTPMTDITFSPWLHRQRRRCAVAALLCAAVLPARALTVVDTGVPSGSAVGAYTLDGTDFSAGQISFGQAMTLQALSTHLLGVAAGETFTLALYADSAAHLPGTLLYSAQATVAGAGWNGVTGLTGWAVAAGSYWVGIELGAADSAGNANVTGALLDRGAPNPLLRTAFDAGSGYQLASPAQSFGLRVDATAAVPEPATAALWALGLAAALAATARRRASL